MNTNNRNVLNDKSNYSIEEASNYLGLPDSTVELWCKGKKGKKIQENDGKSIKNDNIETNNDITVHDIEPLITVVSLNGYNEDNLEDKQSTSLTFYNLVELFVYNSIYRTYDLSLVLVNEHLRTVKRTTEYPMPLIEQWFVKYGAGLLLKGCGVEITKRRLTDPLTRTNKNILLADFYKQMKLLDRDDEGFPTRLYLVDRDSIFIDPNINFGRPTLVQNSITTLAIAERFVGGDSITHLAREYDVDATEILKAINFESRNFSDDKIKI